MRKLIFLLLIISQSTYAVDSEQAKQAAKNIFEKSSSAYTKESLTKVFTSGGYSEQESSEYATKLLKLFNSDEFIGKIQGIYIKHFTAEELVQISEILDHPAYAKFLRLRPIIQQEMSAEINKITTSIK
ncbi:hypothetical protein AN944_03536 [Shewanella sp. P1-14-1]|uniref:DUF2059 domain-containing protein n=1 Tax=Shewanella sp. P1-14-1 TaxID=1723761 RepID=UPI0006D65427|nr:DUF2059 domain-containing protein [Shewanella sp. P1-14-1]KPZ68553.1 hypothetical protein AN944_03536 [Shewanella sp. P1-14-1]